MSVAITPDYMQFVMVLFWVVVLEGFLKILAGLLHVERDHRTHYGAIDMIAGFVLLIIAAWVVF